MLRERSEKWANVLVKGKFGVIYICETKLKSKAVEDWNGVKCVRGVCGRVREGVGLLMSYV